MIFGAGGYGCVVQELALSSGDFDKIAFLDDVKPGVVGTFADYVALLQNFDCAFVAIGDPRLRLSWMEKVERAGYELPVLIHPRAWVSPSANIGAGSVGAYGSGH